MFKQLAGLGSMLKQAQQIPGKMRELNEKLAAMRATGSAGGGMVEVEVSGLMEAVRCTIEEQLIAGGDRELIEDLVVTAMNSAVAKAKELHADAMKGVTGDMEMPDLENTLKKFLGPEAAEMFNTPEEPEEPKPPTA